MRRTSGRPSRPSAPAPLDAGRDPAAVRLGAVFHTVLVDDPARALTMAKSMAAGYYEYSPALFDPPRLAWTGKDPETLKREQKVWPDFHHAVDLEIERARRGFPS